MSLFVIRHGETVGNATRVVQLPDAPLSERGRGQAERLGERLARSGIERILTSDYERAHATGEALRRHTGAKLEVPDIFECPPDVTLRILHGPTHRCKVRWQSGKSLGVEFLAD